MDRVENWHWTATDPRGRVTVMPATLLPPVDQLDRLITVVRTAVDAGDVAGFAPPGDIHRVRNSGDETAISIHVYGTDISRIDSSVRREYHLPVRD
jgi:3-mercaptopropionate dioxygenase